MGERQKEPQRAVGMFHEPFYFYFFTRFSCCFGAPHFSIIDTGRSSNSTQFRVFLPSEDALLFFVLLPPRHLFIQHKRSEILPHIIHYRKQEAQTGCPSGSKRIFVDERIRPQVLISQLVIL